MLSTARPAGASGGKLRRSRTCSHLGFFHSSRSSKLMCFEFSVHAFTSRWHTSSLFWIMRSVFNASTTCPLAWNSSHTPSTSLFMIVPKVRCQSLMKNLSISSDSSRMRSISSSRWSSSACWAAPAKSQSASSKRARSSSMLITSLAAVCCAGTSSAAPSSPLSTAPCPSSGRSSTRRMGRPRWSFARTNPSRCSYGSSAPR
mmetsp:Transcript_8490/g.26645  ORF Transcript_8490/g.26645 Transcript_8490/m.26645 type:complete len:202 (+) Transcript_8490:447-1052(+)